jgi:plasmid stability protein
MCYQLMPPLLVRGLEEAVVAELRRRAARNGRSVEAEHRSILRAALAPDGEAISLKAQLTAMPPVGQDVDFARIRPKPPRARR